MVNGGGTLVADNATGAISSSSTLVLDNGTFVLKGLAGASRTQVFNGLVVNGGTNTIQVDNSGGISTIIDLGFITYDPQIGGIVRFLTTSGSLDDTTAVIKTSLGNTAGVLGTWASVNGGGLATRNANGNIVAFGGYTPVVRLGGQIANNSGYLQIVDGGVSGNIKPTAAGTTNISALVQGATGDAVYEPGNSDILRFDSGGGILVGPGKGALMIGAAADDGAVTAGNNTGSG